MLFHLHNHPWGTNLNGTKASGNYKEYNRVPSGEKVSNYYTNSDLWTLNNIYNTYKEANPKKVLKAIQKLIYIILVTKIKKNNCMNII